MIDKQTIVDTVNAAIAETPIFVVSINIDRDNNITVELDSPDGLDIDTCAAITRAINDTLDRDAEDYSLEVGSAGLTAPFTVPGQYYKNIGNQVEVITRDGRKLRGTLIEAVPTADDTAIDHFTIEVAAKVKEPGAKRPSIVMQPTTLDVAAVKSVKYLIDFK